VKPAGLALAVAVAVAGSLAAAPAAAGEQDSPVVLHGQGSWTLPELGATGLRLPVEGKVGRRSVPVAFPPAASQPRQPSPRSLSYLIHMNLLLEVSRFSGSGVAVISGITNGCPSAQMNVHVRRRPGRTPIISWNTTELIHGIRSRRVKDRTQRLKFSNYLPFCGVKPGRTRLQFVLQKIGGIKLDRAVVLPSSGLEVSDTYRAQLALEPDEPEQVPRVGQEFEVGFDLENIGDAPAHGVGVEILIPGDEFRIVGRRTIWFGDLTGRRSGIFRVVGKKTGEFKLELQALAANANQPVAILNGEVASPDEGRSGLPGVWLTLLWAAAVLISGFYFMKMWRSRSAA